MRNWLLGMRINKDVLKAQRAEYGEQIVKRLAKALTNRYGEGFTKTNLYNYVGFYKTWPGIFHAVSGKSDESIESYIFHALSGKSDIIPSLMGQSDGSKIVNAVSSQLPATTDNIVNAVSSQSSLEAIFQSLTGKNPIRLTWTHYRIILQENSKEARDWYEQEAAREMWAPEGEPSTSENNMK